MGAMFCVDWTLLGATTSVTTTHSSLLVVLLLLLLAIRSPSYAGCCTHHWFVRIELPMMMGDCSMAIILLPQLNYIVVVVVAEEPRASDGPC